MRIRHVFLGAAVVASVWKCVALATASPAPPKPAAHPSAEASATSPPLDGARFAAAPAFERGSSSDAPGYHGLVVDGASGAPLADVEVRLCRGATDARDACDGELATTTTDEAGRFTIAWPRPDSAQSDDDDDGALADGDDAPRLAVSTTHAAAPEPPPEPAALAFSDGERASVVIVGARLAEARGPSGVRVSMLAGATLSGRVRDRAGRPIEGARVGAYRREARLTLADAEHTDDDGQYELTDVPSGDVVVYAVTSDEGQLAAATVSAHIGPGEHVLVDLVVERRPALRVRGRVVDRQGRPLALVRVAVDDGRTAEADRVAAAEQTVSTSTDGTFEMSFLGVGPHHLQLWAPDEAAHLLLAEAELHASADPPETRIAVWDEGVVACSLVGARGEPRPILGYEITASVRGGDTESSSGDTTGSGDDARASSVLAFVWSPRYRSVTVSLSTAAGDGHVELRSPADPCRVVADPTHARARRRHIHIDPIDTLDL